MKKESKQNNLPQHVAIIMDGNRRWAIKRGLSKLEGHNEGAKTLRNIVDHCIKQGIKYLTVYAFSTENWKRTKREINTLFKLIWEGVKEADEWNKKGVRVSILGDLSAFSKPMQKAISRVVNLTKNNQAIDFNIALNYGGRAEIVNAVKKIISERLNSKLVTAEVLGNYLYTVGQPDPDLVIRTGCNGRLRLSGFLPWQTIYSELYFTGTLWPDFTPRELDKALKEYSSRTRNFGE